MNDYLNWPCLAQVFKLVRRFVYLASSKAHHEVQYGLTSLRREAAGPKRFLEIARSEWGIENGLHYRRDVKESPAAFEPIERSNPLAQEIDNNIHFVECQENFIIEFYIQRMDFAPFLCAAVIK